MPLSIDPGMLYAEAAKMQPVPSAEGAESPEDRLRALRWAMLLGGGMTDAVGTQIGKARGGVEVNPLMRMPTPLMYGVKGGANVGLAVLVDKVAQTNPKLAAILALALGGAQAGLGVRNVMVTR